jgi:hypothetical protein
METLEKIRIYSVVVSTENDSDIVFEGTDLEKAKSEFGDYYGYEKYSVSLEYEDIVVKCVGDEEDIALFPAAEYWNDEEYWEIVERDDYEIIDTIEIDREEENEESYREKYTEIYFEVQDYLEEITSEMKRSSSRYFLKPTTNGNILIRLSGHFFNPENIRIDDEVVWSQETVYCKEQNGLVTEDKIVKISGYLSINILDLNWYSNKQQCFIDEYKRLKEKLEYNVIDSLTYEITEDDEFDIEEIKEAIDLAIENIENEIIRANGKVRI